MLHDDDDYDSYFEDTMRAGHYENRKESVDIMIRGSQDVIHDLIGYGVDFAKEDGKLLYTREGAHSRPRILFHEDITGKEITSKLLAQIKTRKSHSGTDEEGWDRSCVAVIRKDSKGNNPKSFSEYLPALPGRRL